MENQHRKISGYRDLTQSDIDLMNKIKSFGPLFEELLAEVTNQVAEQRKGSHLLETGSDRSFEQARLDRAQPERWIAMSKTHFQEGLMALTRAIAQPTTF